MSALPGVTIRQVSGHTPGHCIVQVDGAVILGDLAVHELQLADPGLTYTGETDCAEAAAQRRRLLPALAAEGTVVALGHLAAAARPARSRRRGLRLAPARLRIRGASVEGRPHDLLGATSDRACRFRGLRAPRAARRLALEAPSAARPRRRLATASCDARSASRFSWSGSSRLCSSFPRCGPSPAACSPRRPFSAWSSALPPSERSATSSPA